MSDKTAEQQVLDGTAWEEFCDAIKEAGAILHTQKAPKDAFNLAEGYRYLTRMLRGGLEGSVEYADRDFPVLRRSCHETIKLGADNPDNYYQSTNINPEYDYRIVGSRGDVPYLSIASASNQYARGGGMLVTGFLDTGHMDIGADGELEVVLSQQERQGNWLPMTADTNQILVRQTHQDRLNEQVAELRIERIRGGQDRPEPYSPEKLINGLQGATRFLKNTTALFEGWAESMLPHENTLPQGDQAYFRMLGGDPNIHYFHSYWQLEEDEVLVLEAPVPDCETWNFQLDNWWMESLDYVNHTVHKNKHTAHYAQPGRVRIVVAHSDPGHPNWIETAGHHNGTMCWRWIGADKHPGLETRVVKLEEIGK